MVDLLFASRYSREEAKSEQVWSLICAMALKWRQEDEEAGREQAFFTIKEAKAMNFQYQAVIRQLRP